MQDSHKLIAQLKEYDRFLVGLYEVDQRLFTKPIRDGRWSVRDIIAHIMMWDSNCVEKTLKKLNGGEQGELEEDADPQSFNVRSAEYGRTLTQKEVLDQSRHYRSELISQLSRLPEEAFNIKSNEINSMTLSTFLERLFISHDQHHIKQIEAFLFGKSDAIN